MREHDVAVDQPIGPYLGREEDLPSGSLECRAMAQSRRSTRSSQMSVSDHPKQPFATRLTKGDTGVASRRS